MNIATSTVFRQISNVELISSILRSKEELSANIALKSLTISKRLVWAMDQIDYPESLSEKKIHRVRSTLYSVVAKQCYLENKRIE